jgi:glyoxylase-like metal-dependent hydrolase (beta-lactamase superfamily II)
MLTVGDAEILRVEEQSRPVSLDLLNPDAELVAANMHWLAPAFVDAEAQTFSLVFQTWIVRLDGMTIVVDPCNGNGRDRLMPHFHQLDTPFLEHLETIVRVDEVDVVFCTHLHCDHCGWNTRLRDGRWTPTFPNARYVFVRREAERWDPRRAGHLPVDYNVGVYEDSVLPVIEAGLAELVGDHHTISPVLRVEPAYGHTSGHSMLVLTTSDGEVVFTGDTFHHPLQVLDPRLHLQGCDDLAAAIETRRRVREMLAERNALMVPAHFSAPHAGRVVLEAGRYGFVAQDVGVSDAPVVPE